MGKVLWVLCQLVISSHTPTSNFDVAINIDSVARHETHIQEIEFFPRFPLQYQGESEDRDLRDQEIAFG